MQPVQNPPLYVAAQKIHPVDKDNKGVGGRMGWGGGGGVAVGSCQTDGRENLVTGRLQYILVNY
jgi:hypothetical protein